MATKKTFNFPLGATVEVRCNSRAGEVVGRAQYARSNPGYLVEHAGDHGGLEQRWFDEEALAKVGPDVDEAEGE